MATDSKATQDTRSVVRDLTAQPQAYRVQAGWQVYDGAGQFIGEVIAREVDVVKVSVAAGVRELVRIPTRVIAEEEEATRRATLAVDAGDLTSLEHQ